ncbi:Thiamine-monophosphate kinase (EC [Olavius sp. associated proteobacterium Delta 1]|nr:Thiamine-monophosphate kinase (EC [Olavius sp. associated proteobacterium Delta 1]
MPLKRIGEFGFIKKISRGCLIRPDSIIKAIGDDAAAFTTDPARVSLITTDLLVERIHFLRNAISGFDLGYKSLAVNLSDIAAMGGTARESFVSIAIPEDCPLDYLEAIYDGMKDLATKFEVNILGGDTTGSKVDLIINVVVHGTIAREEMLCRDAARPGDIIFSTGYLGDSKAGLHLILNNIPADSAEWRNLLRAHLLPVPQLAQGRFLAQRSAVKAAIDTSDGLSSDLGHIAEESGVGAVLYADKIPVSGDLKEFCQQFNFDPVEYALSGGEDYTLLCTVSPAEAEVIAADFQKKFKRPLFRIGEITAGKEMNIIFPDGSSSPIASSGWNHFKDE